MRTSGISYNEVMRFSQLYENLIKHGISPNNVHYYLTPHINSGYSMGEKVSVMCNNVEIERRDYTQEYAKSCTYRTKHGLVVFNFTKKGLKDYIRALKAHDVDSARKIAFECFDAKKSIVNQRNFKTL